MRAVMRPPTKRNRIWASLCRRNSDRGHAVGRAARRRCASLVTAGRRASVTSEQRVALRANLEFRLIATITVAENESVTRNGSNIRRRSKAYGGIVQSCPNALDRCACMPQRPFLIATGR
ncbi:hypothetical protein EYR26_12850 [Xanthomonas oryzae]|nr:hypothetical protein EYR26_12850 [Xanthomonas oryzae]